MPTTLTVGPDGSHQFTTLSPQAYKDRYPLTPTLAQEQARVTAAIDARRDELLSGTCTVWGREYQIDERSRANLAGEVLEVRTGQYQGDVKWILADNNVTPIPQGEFDAAVVTIRSYVQALYFVCRAKKDAVLAMTADIQTYDIEAGWPSSVF